MRELRTVFERKQLRYPRTKVAFMASCFNTALAATHVTREILKFHTNRTGCGAQALYIISRYNSGS